MFFNQNTNQDNGDHLELLLNQILCAMSDGVNLKLEHYNNDSDYVEKTKALLGKYDHESCQNALKIIQKLEESMSPSEIKNFVSMCPNKNQHSISP